MPNLSEIILLAPPILLALTFHEYAHGLVAYLLGDPTAQRAGRLTLNPISHLDPIGTIMLFIARIGWAKPVPVNPYNFQNPRRDIVLVSLAGPVANLVIAFAVGLLFKVLVKYQIFMSLPEAVAKIIGFALSINILLAIFNLLPIPPLDGSKILGGLLPPELEQEYRKFERYGPIVLLVLVFGGYLFNFSLLMMILSPFYSFFVTLFVGNLAG
jgi:Zn-dependent protease